MITKSFCSFEVSKKLVDNGIEINSFAYWVKRKDGLYLSNDKYNLMLKRKDYFEPFEEIYYSTFLISDCDYYPAPSASELFELLPSGALICKGECTGSSTVVFKNMVGYDLNLANSIAELIIKNQIK